MDFGEQFMETDQFQKQKMRNDCVGYCALVCI